MYGSPQPAIASARRDAKASYGARSAANSIEKRFALKPYVEAALPSRTSRCGMASTAKRECGRRAGAAGAEEGEGLGAAMGAAKDSFAGGFLGALGLCAQEIFGRRARARPG